MSKKRNDKRKAAEIINEHSYRVVESLPPIPDTNVVAPGYIRSQKQLEEGGADLEAVLQQKRYGEENKL